MIWFMLILGIVIGAGGYYAYDKFFNKAESAVQAKESAIKAEVKAEIAKFKPKGKK